MAVPESEEPELATPYVIHLAEVASTQDVAAAQFADHGGVSPVVVVADRQVAGRGRSGREWWEAPRAMYSSVALAPAWPHHRWGPIPLVVGLAVREALGDLAEVEIGLKWPNDLMLDGRKIGGVLVEASGDVVVIGCGINLWWPDVPDGADAVYADDPGEAAARHLAALWSARVIDRLDDPTWEWRRDDYLKASVTLGIAIEWDPDGAGTAVDVADDGALVVDVGGRTIELRSGEVRSVRPATLPAHETEE